MNDRNNKLDEVQSGTPPRPRVRRIITHNRWLLVVTVLVIVAAIASVLLLRRSSGSQEGRPVPAPTGAPVPSPSAESSGGVQPRAGEVTITLSPDKLENAQIKTEMATEQTGAAATSAGGKRTTGTVQS